MNTHVEIICDRCEKTIHGVVIEDPRFPKVTGGFYDVTEGSSWHEFARSSLEWSVCDRCMWEDPKFQEKYPGPNKKIPLT